MLSQLTLSSGYMAEGRQVCGHFRNGRLLKSLIFEELGVRAVN
jgi:hypothetical protein